MLKLASIADFDLVFSMAMKFAQSTDLGKYADEDKITALIKEVLSSPQDQKIVILFEDKGMVAGIKQPFLLGTVDIATELCWWVDPDHRGKKIGKELAGAFEYWATNIAKAKLIALACYDDEVGKAYEKNGYRLYERAYLKEV